MADTARNDKNTNRGGDNRGQQKGSSSRDRYNKERDDNRGGGQGGGRKRMYFRKKVCRFCADKNLRIDYKDYDILRRFVTEGGKIIPKRISGNCSKHQRLLSREIKKARAIALLPYVRK